MSGGTTNEEEKEYEWAAVRSSMNEEGREYKWGREEVWIRRGGIVWMSRGEYEWGGEGVWMRWGGSIVVNALLQWIVLDPYHSQYKLPYTQVSFLRDTT